MIDKPTGPFESGALTTVATRIARTHLFSRRPAAESGQSRQDQAGLGELRPSPGDASSSARVSRRP